MNYPLNVSFHTKFYISKLFLLYFIGQQLVVCFYYLTLLTIDYFSFNPNTIYEKKLKHFLKCYFLYPSFFGSNQPNIIFMKIIKIIKVEDNQFAYLATIQPFTIIAITAHNLPKNPTLVAKFYNILYFDHNQNDAIFFFCVDCNYLHKTITYTAFFIL